MRTPKRALAGLVALLVLAGAAAFLITNRRAGPSLPELPPPALGDAVPFVQEQIRDAYSAFLEEPRDLEANVKIATVLHAYGHLDLAVIAYRRASLLAPRDFRWAYLLGMAQAAAGARAEATSTLAHAITLDDRDYTPARIHLAELLLESGELEPSGRLLEGVLAHEPDMPIAHYHYGRLLARRGDLERAVKHLGRAVALSPRYGPAHYALAIAYRELEDGERAQHHLERYQSCRDEKAPVKDQLLFEVEMLNDGPAKRLERAESLATAGHLEASIREYLRVLEIDPSNLAAHSWLIRLYGKSGDLAKAREHYRRALEVNPDWSEGHAHFGAVLLHHHRFEEAVGVLSASARGNPYSAEARSQLGLAYEGVGDLQKAIRTFLHALEIEPNNLAANARVGLLLLKRGTPSAAIPHLELAYREARAQGQDALAKQIGAALEKAR